MADAAFGHSVSVSGGWAVVGAPYQWNNASDWLAVGAAYMLYLDQGIWTHHSRLDVGQGYNCTGAAVAIDGDWVAVSSPGDYPSPVIATVSLFKREGDSWTLMQQVGPSQEGAISVALAADVLAIGYPAVGHLDMYRRVNGVYQQERSLRSNAMHLGQSLALAKDGTRVVAGGSWPAQPGDITGMGGATVYDYHTDKADWRRAGAAEDVCRKASSMAVAIAADGLTFALSCPSVLDTSTRRDAGLVEIYQKDPDSSVNFITVASMRGDQGNKAEFGTSLCYDHSAAEGEEVLVVGAPHENSDQGSVFVYKAQGVEYTLDSRQVMGQVGQLGASLTIDNGTIMAGAPVYSDPTGDGEEGEVVVFNVI
ncbi:hypothetical protein KIPB_005477 [Kipferlia bialata]|uniref:Uncharacterized protein n=1 Tax=Kipferlia bialata TaxID=797122 RepID=A0A9K3CYJ7_9EUKA|nr:hypothetical protein KIPB_005477 [Kipferlia bialata]|eukprot:g5477.t1